MTLTISADPVPLVRGADGVLRIGDTRVTLDTLIAAFQLGATAEEIAQRYSSLNLADVYAVIGFYLRHSADVDEYLKLRGQQALTTRKDNESRFDPAGVRARLLERQLSGS